MQHLIKKTIWLIIALPLAYLAFAWHSLPDTIAVHFNIEGNADRFGPKTELLVPAVILTVLNTGVYLLLTNAHRMDPKRTASMNQARLQRIAFVTTLFMSAVLCLIVYGSMKGNMKSGGRLIFCGIGILFCVIGNYMHALKPNYFAGIRSPWALEDETNWKKTHLLAGRLFFAGGLLMALICLFTPDRVSLFVVPGITLLVSAIPFVYSYRLYKQKKRSLNTNRL
ncbi:MAG: SdpI family protein [Chitinophagaceae bacterium]